MKSLIIEQCKNGWIVRPREFTNGYTTEFPISSMTVYHTIEELQKALPELLQEEPLQGQDKQPVTYSSKAPSHS